jgi:hypothetical protein
MATLRLQQSPGHDSPRPDLHGLVPLSFWTGLALFHTVSDLDQLSKPTLLEPGF